MDKYMMMELDQLRHMVDEYKWITSETIDQISKALHGSAYSYEKFQVLSVGPGCGKSTLALRLLCLASKGPHYGLPTQMIQP